MYIIFGSIACLAGIIWFFTDPTDIRWLVLIVMAQAHFCMADIQKLQRELKAVKNELNQLFLKDNS